MLGKVSVQPSVGHWKVLPEQRNRVEIQQEPDHAGDSPTSGSPAPPTLSPVPSSAVQHLPEVQAPPPPALPELQVPLCHLPAKKKRTPWSDVGCPGLTLEGLCGSVVDLEVVHQLLHAGEGQFAAVARALVVLPWKERDRLASSLPQPLLSPPQGRTGLTWDRSALQRPQVLRWGPSAPRHRHRAAGQSRFAATWRGEAVRRRVPSATGSAGSAEPQPCLNHVPLCPPSHPLQLGGMAIGGVSGLEGAGGAGALQGG